MINNLYVCGDVHGMYKKFINVFNQVKLDDNDINGASGICNNIEDLCHVFSCAMTNMYSYSIEDGKIKHPTERGQKLADIFNN